MELVVRGRNVEVPEHFRTHVAEKFARVERYDARIIRADVELTHEPNRRQSEVCQRVEITCRVRGPVVRAEACAENFYSALDAAVDKVEARFRRAADRRRVHHGRHAPRSVAEATAGDDLATGATTTALLEALPDFAGASDGAASDAAGSGTPAGARSVDGTGINGAGHDGRPDNDGEGPGRVVREKVHDAVPMTVDQALLEMELVGHDFFLFHDAQADRPSVVYRRHAYDYGLIRLGSG